MLLFNRKADNNTNAQNQLQHSGTIIHELAIRGLYGNWENGQLKQQQTKPKTNLQQI